MVAKCWVQAGLPSVQTTKLLLDAPLPCSQLLPGHLHPSPTHSPRPTAHLVDLHKQ